MPTRNRMPSSGIRPAPPRERASLHMAREEFPGRLCLEINASMPYIRSRDQHLILASRVYGSPSNGFWLAPSLH
jgi:hypothetical protein